MYKVKQPNDVTGLAQLSTRPITTTDVKSKLIPARTIRNIKRGHLIKGIRSINRMARELWEDNISEMLTLIDIQNFTKANQFFNALEHAQILTNQVLKREKDLQATYEELEASNEELQSTTEELEANNEELQATSEELETTNEELQATAEEMERTIAYRRTLMDSMLDILMTTDRSGIITEVNRATERFSGYQADELLNKRFATFFTEPDRAQAGVDQVSTGKDVSNYDLTLITKEGKDVLVSYNATPLRDTDGRITGVLGSARNITELRRIQQSEKNLIEKAAASDRKRVIEGERAYKDLQNVQAQLIQSGKMSAVGTMTAGIAHELNNPFMGILNFIQYSIKHTSKDDKKYQVLLDAERETKRCITILQSLLTFSRPEKEKEEYQKVKLTDLLDRVLQLLTYRIKDQSASVSRHIVEATPQIWVKPNNIQQVFFNFILNALDAVKETEKKEIHVDICRKAKFVQVAVADTGCGIVPENLPKIFEPFFTTKPPGQGTGLGLSVNHSIIRAHGGDITCESKLGIGTKFNIQLPIERKENK